MAAKIAIQNQGSGPLMIRGLKQIGRGEEVGGTEAQHTGDPSDRMLLMPDDVLILHPINTKHFHDFVDISYKAKS